MCYQFEKEYVEKDGGFCPVCHSYQIEGGSLDLNPPYVTQRMVCIDCDLTWYDVYKLIRVESDSCSYYPS